MKPPREYSVPEMALWALVIWIVGFTIACAVVLVRDA